MTLSAESQRKFDYLNSLAEQYDALLFDVDGTLADNMRAHKDAYVAAALRYGIVLDDAIIDETAGWPTVAVAQLISQRYQVDFDYQEFADLKSAIFRDEFVLLTEPVDFVVAHLKYQVGKKKIGAVSGGRKQTLQLTLTTIDVIQDLQTIVSSEDTKEGKPSPQPFLLAAKNLDTLPSKCLVYEDGIPGVEGAMSAGMGWVRVDEL